ncbi:DUF2927 domain-containing protein [Oculatella sp. LEGE 06141]|uniref:DUF2927 domain-containing protein n=1 Tax=Oculatella sp. LEGE 06141 TaxID=1828648 RepID=UPI0018802355|nr:DUF2927 domain-containing protein [Oculatella sp. LEGE 06141]MBE9180103.1 DUF2927 domain-containing protein [Oculatella sp. LEGE 06141]
MNLTRLFTAVPLTIASICISLPALAQPGMLTARNATSRINIRTAPSTQAIAHSYGVVGDHVTILNQTVGDDGSQWYQVQFDASRMQGWVHSAFVQVAPSSVSPTSETTLAAPSLLRPAIFAPEEIDYFLEVAMGAEWGGASSAVRRWEDEIRVQYFGSPTPADLATLQTVIAEVNDLIGSTTRLRLVNTNPNMEIYFTPESSFRRYEPNYVPTNMGFFWTWWNQDNVLNRARILIATQGITQQERNHLIREELTQSLGLMQDSYRYADSIFYQGWTEVTQYSTLDKTLLQMLYHPRIRAGMARSEVESILQRLQRSDRT